MPQMIDPQVAIRAAQPGTMVYARFSRSATAPRETGLFIRELPRYVKRIPATPAVELRFGAFHEGVAMPMVVMVHFSADMLYETWFNACANAQECADMATQERLAIVFFQPERARQIEISNPLQAAFANAAAIIETMPAWTMTQFDEARERIYQRLPTPVALWDTLS